MAISQNGNTRPNAHIRLIALNWIRQNDLPFFFSLLVLISFKPSRPEWQPYVNSIFFSLLQNLTLNGIHFFSALTLGLKKADIGFMPLLSTLARLFWATVIFLGGWNKRKENQHDSTTLHRASRKYIIHHEHQSIQQRKNRPPQVKPLGPRQSLKKARVRIT